MRFANLKLTLHWQLLAAPTLSLLACMTSRVHATDYSSYQALDPSQPVSFDGGTVKWNDSTFVLDELTLFLDYRLDSEQIESNPFAFNNLEEAANALRNGTAEKPMRLLIAPGVYWVDDPDDPAIRSGDNGEAPIGITIACDHLYFHGLSTKRENVVFAVNRGQTQGAAGNFTMFKIQGIGLKSENVTFGNYCNVDLDFPLNPALNRAKRAEAIAQAQLFFYSSHDGLAINTGFVSRLNLLPFATTFKNCHIESSGHASFHNGIYVGSTLEFYGSNFASGTFLDCDITFESGPGSNTKGSTRHFGFRDGTGTGGVCVDTRFHRSQELIENNIAVEVSWDRFPQATTTRGYQHNVTLDGRPYIIQESATPGATIVMKEDSDLLKAYKITHDGTTYYNIPNLVPDVDPTGMAKAIKAAAVAAGKREDYYLSIPKAAALRVASDSADTIRSGQTTTRLNLSVSPDSHNTSPALGKWEFTATPSDNVQITPDANGSITVAGLNNTDEPVEVTIVATNELGIEACSKLTVEPAYLEPPGFSKEATITPPSAGRVELSYDLSLESSSLTDESLITWYRCADAEGSHPLKVAVSRRNRPETSYAISQGDVGYYLMATIQPKHNRSEAGTLRRLYLGSVIAKDDVKIRVIDTDFQNFPTDPQPQILPGTWTLDGYFAPEAVGPDGAPLYTANPDSWTYGAGQSGSLGYFGLDEIARGARLAYTPAGSQYSDMTVRATFAPDKTAGQGFGSATQQFLEVFIKYDLASQTGYGLRIQRLTTEEVDAIGFDGNGAVTGCVYFLTHYEKGVMTPISEKVMCSALLTECTVELRYRNGRLLASVTSTKTSRSADAFGYPREVQFNESVSDNGFGGNGMFFTGTVGFNSILVTGWQTLWSTE